MGRPWTGVIKLPEGTSGNFAIRHMHRPAGTALERHLPRTLIFTGEKPLRPLFFPQPTVWHELVEYDDAAGAEGRGEPQGRWMSDLPIEQYQLDKLMRGMRGNVLVGGLGIGYCAQVLARRRSVDRVIVVEKSADVIKLVHPHLQYAHKIDVVHADLFDFLRNDGPYAGGRGYFDWALYDIWASDGEGTFFDTVVPLRKLTEDKHWLSGADLNHRQSKIRCWNENVMRGQLQNSLLSPLQLLALPADSRKKLGMEHGLDDLCEYRQDKWWDWKVPFYRRLRAFGLADSPMSQAVLLMAHRYAQGWGRPEPLSEDWS